MSWVYVCVFEDTLNSDTISETVQQSCDQQADLFQALHTISWQRDTIAMDFSALMERKT